MSSDFRQEYQNDPIDTPRYRFLPRWGSISKVEDTHTGEVKTLTDLLAAAKGVNIDSLPEVVKELWGTEVAA